MSRTLVVALPFVFFVGACSLFVNTGGLDTETDATGDAVLGDTGTGDAPSSDGSLDAGNETQADVVVQDAPSDGCPSGKGPDMVALPNGECIDSTEVTQAQYDAFLNWGPSINGQLPECSWNGSYLSSTTGNPPSFPVTGVDWCDAYAFCKWAGKHLCGKIGGGTLDMAENTNATQSQWFNACSAGGSRTYPYGTSYIPGACNAVDGGSVSAVKSFSQCVGGYPGIYDLAGNVEEWQDSCETPATGPDDLCREQAGTFDLVAPPLTSTRCDFLDEDIRSGAWPDVGIRCCFP
jgi:formylglycine-generating enzyme required for sulfatase activity